MISLLATQPLVGQHRPTGTREFFLRLIADPGAAAKRLEELTNAGVKANETIISANEDLKNETARKTHDETLRRERQEHDRSIAAARAKSDFACALASDEIREMRADAEKLHGQAKADAAAASELRADLERRLDNIKRAAA